MFGPADERSIVLLADFSMFFSLESFFSRVSLEVFTETSSLFPFFCRPLPSVLLLVRRGSGGVFSIFFIDFFLLFLLYRLAKLSMLNDTTTTVEFLGWIHERDLRLIGDSLFRRNKRASWSHWWTNTPKRARTRRSSSKRTFRNRTANRNGSSERT